jgi:hypothetical protein
MVLVMFLGSAREWEWAGDPGNSKTPKLQKADWLVIHM